MRHLTARGVHGMLDLVLVLATIAFFGASLAFARWLDGLDAREAP